MNMRRIFNSLEYIKIAVFLLLTGIAIPSSYASVFFSSDPTPSNVYIAGPVFLVCIQGPQPCPDGYWTQLALPSLGVGEQASLTTSSSSFGFYLGNTLNGDISISLSPYFRTNSTPSQDELIVNVMNRTSTISTSDFGNTTFHANFGEDYYALLSGEVRAGQTYQMQITAVPLPASGLLFLSGIMFFSKFSGKRKR